MITSTYNETTFTIEKGFDIKAKTWGSDKGNPVLALHGWLDNANTFDKIAVLLPDNFFLVALDLAGHGLSDHRNKNTSYHIWDYAIDTIKVIELLKWDHFSILAHSLGTGVSSIIASTFHNKINKIIFIDGLGAPFVTDENDVVSNFKKSLQQFKMAKKAKLFGFSDPEIPQFETKVEAINDRMKNSIGKISYEASEILLERTLISKNNGYRLRNDPRLILPEPIRLTENQAQKFISQMNCETLIILGKQGMFANGLFEKRLNKFKNAKVHWLEGGHHLHLEDSYRKVSTLINKFLIHTH